MPNINHHHINLFKQQLSKLHKLAGIGWNVGDLVLFRGRLAEVIYDGKKGGPTIIEITDEGGIIHSYSVRTFSELRPLVEHGECTLDAVRRAVGPELTQFEKMRRTAETWLADPQVGDTFLVGNELLEIVTINKCGPIYGAMYIAGELDFSSNKATHEVSWLGPNSLRNQLRSKSNPVYNALAFRSKRPEINSYSAFYDISRQPATISKTPLFPGGKTAR